MSHAQIIRSALDKVFEDEKTHVVRAAVIEACKAVREGLAAATSIPEVCAIDDVFDEHTLGRFGHGIRSDSFLYPRAVYLIAECFWQADAALSLRKDTTDFALRHSDDRRWRRPWLAMLCAEYHALRNNDRGAALWWGALGYIADVMAGPAYTQTSGNENLLRFLLGVPDTTFDLLRNLGESAGKRPVINTDVSRLEHAPESVLVDALQNAAALPLIGPSQEYTYPACRAFVAAARRVVAGQDPDARALWLERLAHYLFMTVPGMRSKRNLVTEESSAELDLSITRLADNAYHAPVVGGRWIAECKSTPKNIEAEHVGHFLAKMTYYRADFGVLIGNVAGESPKLDDQLSRFGAALVRGHDRSSDRPCVTVRLAELAEIEDDLSGISFRDLLTRKFDVLRYGREKAAPKSTTT